MVPKAQGLGHSGKGRRPWFLCLVIFVTCFSTVVLVFENAYM